MESKEIILKSVYKAKLLGACKQYKTACSHRYEIMSISDKDIVYIPDNVRRINSDSIGSDFGEPIRDLKNNIIFIGGGKLKSLYDLLGRCNAKSVDLRFLDTSTVNTMEGMFFHCKTDNICFGDFNTKQVKTMKNMFRGCCTNKLELNTLSSESLTDASYMFYKCKCKTIEVMSDSFKLNNDVNTHYMFDNLNNYDDKTTELKTIDNQLYEIFTNRKYENAIDLISN